MRMRIAACVTACGLAIGAMAQAPDIDWYLTDPGRSGFNGINFEKLSDLLDEKGEAEPVIVAVLDSGIDIDHEDLKDNIWRNEDEIAGNGIDDDHNGYIDDIHGWNFLGGPDGRNVVGETLEITRLYAAYREYFKDKDIDDLSKKDQELYKTYLEYKETVQSEREKAQKALDELRLNEQYLVEAMQAFEKKYPDQELTTKFIENFDPGEDVQMQIVKQVFSAVQGYEMELTDMKSLIRDVNAGYDEAARPLENKVYYRYNPDFNSREIIGDNYADQYERYYGNNDVVGGYASHGTMVAGIIGAVRDNDIGINGIADNVRLMVLRVVPDGDEHDKDVANAIRYAVENGASVINMSFGKGQSWNKQVVDDAVRFAEKKDVLLVHAAGNDSYNNDLGKRYPSAEYEKHCFLFGRKRAKNWIAVGALFWEPGKDAIASFSNYGKNSVDVFAPGVQIYSTAPGDAYDAASGTSMSAPVVTGVAALLRSHFPRLTAEQVREILIDSARDLPGKVRKPNSPVLTVLDEISISGGALDAYRAYKLAETVKGKKKIRKSSGQEEHSSA